MLEARIQSPKGSLYFAAEATPYDLELLQRYVRDLTPANAVSDLELEVSLDERDPTAPFIAEWLGHLAATGVRVACGRGLVPR